MSEPMRPVWFPTFPYTSHDPKTGHPVSKSFFLPGETLNECPVSYITGASAELVQKYNLAKRHKRRFSALIGRDDAWAEDVEDTLLLASQAVKEAFDEEMNRR